MAERSNWVVEDFQRIAEIVEPGEVVHYSGGWARIVPGVPYLSGVCLPWNPIGSPARAEWVISRKPEPRPDNRTPDNRGIFLFRGPGVSRAAE
jgi:hypothetical protein